MGAKLRFRDIFFLMANLLTGVICFVPFVSVVLDVVITVVDRRKMDTRMISLCDCHVGWVIIILAATSIFLYIFKERTIPSCITGMFNSVLLGVSMFFAGDYYLALAKASGHQTSLSSVNKAETTLMISYYAAYAVAGLLLLACIICLVGMRRDAKRSIY